MRVEIFQPRDPREFYDEGKGEPTNKDRFNTLRGIAAGMYHSKEITWEFFGKNYELVGTDTVSTDEFGYHFDIDELREKIFEQWNNGSGKESPRFRKMNSEHRATSLNSGDIIRIDGTAYLCEPVGWSELPKVSF